MRKLREVMSMVERPRARPESIPDRRGMEELAARRFSYRAPSSYYSSCPSSPRPLDDDEARPTSSDCGPEKPSPEAVAKTAPRPPVQDDDNDDADDMLSVVHTDGGSDVAAPALPAKSALRKSRLLASLAQKAVEEQHRPILPHAAPHQVYLSSEEDASSSADDLSELDELDSGSEQSHRSSASRASNEDTARVVTVVFHGRPSIIDLPRRSGPTDHHRPATGILRTSTEPTLVRTRSVSSSASSAVLRHPPRSSSMMPSGFQIKRPQFLTIDPFTTKLPESDEQDPARLQKTPSAMFKKTLDLVKKRSRPLLRPTTLSPESLALHVSPMEQVGEEPEPESPRPASPPRRASMNYQSMMRTARRTTETFASPPATPPEMEAPSPPSSHRSRFRSGLSMSRPRNMRA